MRAGRQGLWRPGRPLGGRPSRRRRELTAILGSSGSGKTTLLRIVIGFVDPDRGAVSLGSSTLVDAASGGSRVPVEQRAIGYVAQEGALFPHLTVGENVGFGLPRAERRTGARIAEALSLVGLDASYAGRQAHQLSGGEQRRVALGRALAPRPRVVLLDEPFSGRAPDCGSRPGRPCSTRWQKRERRPCS